MLSGLIPLELSYHFAECRMTGGAFEQLTNRWMRHAGRSIPSIEMGWKEVHTFRSRVQKQGTQSPIVRACFRRQQAVSIAHTLCLVVSRVCQPEAGVIHSRCAILTMDQALNRGGRFDAPA